MSERSNPDPTKASSDSNIPSQPPQSNRVEHKVVQKATQTIIQWTPLGGSGYLFVHLLLQQDWLLAVMTFPTIVVTAVWAAYTESFVARLREIYSDRGRRDADSFTESLKRLDEAIR